MPERMRYYLVGFMQGVGGTLLVVWLTANWRTLFAPNAGPSGLLLPFGSVLFIVGSLLARMGRKAPIERLER